MSEKAACAHRLVSWCIERNDDGTHTGWWECDSGCGMKFEPIIYHQSTMNIRAIDNELPNSKYIKSIIGNNGIRQGPQ
jgi:hypothetical protein